MTYVRDGERLKNHSEYIGNHSIKSRIYFARNVVVAVRYQHVIKNSRLFGYHFIFCLSGF